MELLDSETTKPSKSSKQFSTSSTEVDNLLESYTNPLEGNDKSKSTSDPQKKIKKSPIKKTNKNSDEDNEKLQEIKKKFVPEIGLYDIVTKSFKFTLQNWKLQLYYQIITIIDQIFSIYLPVSKSKIINAITKTKKYNDLFYSVIEYIMLNIIRLIITDGSKYISCKYLKDEAKEYKKSIIENIAKKDIIFFDIFKTGELKDRIEQSERCLNNSFLFKTVSLFLYLFKFYFICSKVWKSAKLLTIVFVSKYIFVFICEQIVNKIFEYSNIKKLNRNKSNYSNALFQFLSNIKLIKSFATEDLEVKKLFEIKDRIDRPIFDWNNFLKKLLALFSRIFDTILLFIAGKKIINKEITYADYIIFQSYSNQLSSSFTKIKNFYNDYRHMIESWRNFFELFEFEPKIKNNDKNLSPKIDDVSGKIEFEDVSFSYPMKEDVLIMDKLNMEIEKGKITALVGHSGIGKTTITNLIQRFYDPNGGVIKIDNIDIKDYNLKWLRRNVGIVSQEPILMDSTIEDNITYGISEYTQEQFDYVCKLSNVDKFINDKSLFPGGVKTLVGAKGANVSGGQKQRIAIARALMKNAKILIFDEATSALDAESENDVQSAIDNISKEKGVTILIIAHRLSTIKNADCILYMEKGKIGEKGTHKELIELDGEYKKLIHRQLDLNG